MALLQAFPAFQPDFSRCGQEVPVPRVVRARPVGFRSGADLTGVIEEVVKGGRVEVNAAPGAGKTVVFPGALAKATGKLVVHVLPYEQLALATHRYLVRNGDVVDVQLITSVQQEFPSTGLVLIPAACLVAKWLSKASHAMPECYVLHDESHESGAASAAVRLLAPVSAGVMAYVAMSATLGPTGARKMETAGQVHDMEYEAEAFADPWSVEEEGAPWAIDSLDGHVLLFEDDRKRADALIQAYNYNGMQAIRLHSRMSATAFLGALDLMDNKYISTPCALIADSTFRSGYTFPVSTIVDSGVVKRTVVGRDGKPVYSARPIYEFERVQSRARGGRCEGQVSTYWRPRADCEAVMCELGQTDVEALALVCRLLGYRVPKQAEGAVMAAGDIPVDPCEALGGAMPLACLPSTKLCPIGELAKKVSNRSVQASVGVSFAKEIVHEGGQIAGQAVVGRGFGQERIEPGVADADVVRFGRAAPGSRGDAGHAFSTDEAFGVLRAFMEPEGEDFSLEFGHYYAASGLATAHNSSVSFPDGVDSVKRALYSDRSRTIQYGWSPYQRSVAVNALLHSYNVDLVRLKALTRCMGRARSDDRKRNSKALHAWATASAEQLTDLAVRTESVLALVQQVAESFCDVHPCGEFQEQEEALAAAYYAQFEAVPTVSADHVVEEVARVKEWVGAAIESYHAAGAVKSIESGGASRKARTVPPLLRYLTGYPRATAPRRPSASSSSSGGTRRIAQGHSRGSSGSTVEYG